MKAFKKEIYWQCDLMAMKKNNVACVHRRNISQYDKVSDVAPEPLVPVSSEGPPYSVASYDLQGDAEGGPILTRILTGGGGGLVLHYMVWNNSHVGIIL
jgi:hypothetical protein